MSKILICDDNDELRESLIQLIEFDFEGTILEAQDGDQAIEIYKNHDDLQFVLSDINMPKVSGIEVFEYNLSQKNLPFILLSGASVENDVSERFLEANKENKIFYKPFNHEEIINIILKVVA